MNSAEFYMNAYVLFKYGMWNRDKEWVCWEGLQQDLNPYYYISAKKIIKKGCITQRVLQCCIDNAIILQHVPKYRELFWIINIIKNTVITERPRNKIAIIKTHRETFQWAKKLKTVWLIKYDSAQKSKSITSDKSIFKVFYIRHFWVLQSNIFSLGPPLSRLPKVR